MHHRVHAVAGALRKQNVAARTQKSPLDGKCDGDVFDAELVLRRCHLSLTEGIFSVALFAKNVAIELKCVENNGGKPWYTPQASS